MLFVFVLRGKLNGGRQLATKAIDTVSVRWLRCSDSQTIEKESIPMIRDRLLEMFALMLIGDGVVGLVQPERHSRLWLQGPQPYREAMRPFVRHPSLTRVIGAGEIAVGLWWAGRQRAGSGSRPMGNP